jgi:hypothetical protein
VTTPAHQLPTIKEGSTIGFRFSVGTWCAIVGSLGSALVVFVGFCIWLHAMYTDVQTMKAQQAEQAEVLQSIDRTVREIEIRQTFGVTTSLPKPPRVSP